MFISIEKKLQQFKAGDGGAMLGIMAFKGQKYNLSVGQTLPTALRGMVQFIS